MGYQEEALKLFNTIMEVLDERDNLIKERDYYKARYLEFNDGMLEGMKVINVKAEVMEIFEMKGFADILNIA